MSRPPGRPGARLHNSTPANAGLPGACAPGSPFSLVEFLQHRDVQGHVRHNALQPSVLFFQLFEALARLLFRSPVLLFPSVMISSGVCRFCFMLRVRRRSHAANSHSTWINFRGARHQGARAFRKELLLEAAILIAERRRKQTDLTGKHEAAEPPSNATELRGEGF